MKIKTLLPLFVFILLLTPVVTLAQFKPLVGIPGISDPNADFNTYINTLYAISISVAALVAVIKIIVAGVKWMLSDLVTSKQDAKSDIQGALIGLLIIISAVLILEVINPQLTQSNLFLSPVDSVSGTGSGSASSNTTTATSPLTTTATVPSTEEDIACEKTTKEYDCTAAKAACTAKKGTPDTYFWSNNKIKCVLGTSKSLYCEITLNSATQLQESDCTKAKASCPSGSTYTQITEYKASCYTPNS